MRQQLDLLLALVPAARLHSTLGHVDGIPALMKHLLVQVLLLNVLVDGSDVNVDYVF